MNLKKILKKVKAAESSISLILGVIVVIIVGVILYNYWQKHTPNTNTSEPVNLSGEEIEESSKTQLQKYVVVKGDDLWKISEKFFGTGYNWTDIAKENHLASPNLIEVGQELIIPSVAPKNSAIQPSTRTVSVNKTINGEQYTVVKGDTLWDISVRAYQDGYKWVEIARANKLTNPNLIHPGNVLIIPR